MTTPLVLRAVEGEARPSPAPGPGSLSGRHLVVALVQRHSWGDVVARPALDVARRLDAELVLATSGEAGVDEARTRLERVASNLPTRDVGMEVLPPGGAEPLAAWLRVRGDPIVCVARTRWRHHLADQVLGLHAGPVLVVPDRGPLPTVGRLVARADGSRVEDFLDAAAAWSGALRVPLTLVAVVPYPPPYGVSRHGLDALAHGYLAGCARGRTAVRTRHWEVLHDRDPARGVSRYVGRRSAVVAVQRRPVRGGRLGLRSTDRQVLTTGAGMVLALPWPG